jgi:hypothetical protein
LVAGPLVVTGRNYWQAGTVGRKARERSARKAEQRARSVALPHPILILWSYPGAGKSHFGRWLSSAHKEFDWMDTDSLGNRPRSPLEDAWWRVINRHAPPRTFLLAAARHGRAIVTEFGVWAEPASIAVLSELQRLGAMVWWFEAERAAALAAWKAENARRGRGYDDQLWARVTDAIDQHWAALAPVFGSRTIRTLGAGGVENEPEEIYATIFGSRGPAEGGSGAR